MFKTPLHVMISLHCTTMNESAQILKNYLEKRGISVWVCAEMPGGASYREDIQAAVNNCYIFLPLLNTSWRKSGECKFEYNIALRRKLTCYEKKRSSEDKGEPRRPVFVPISFSDLDWDLEDHVNALSCSVNFIPHNGLNLLEGKQEVTLETVYKSVATALNKFGFKFAITTTTTTSESKVGGLSAAFVSDLDKKLKIGASPLGPRTPQKASEASGIKEEINCGVTGHHHGDTLNHNESLSIHQHLHSKNGIFSAVMQGDGNFVLYKNVHQVLWATNTNGTGADHLVLQSDRNLVIYTQHRAAAKWASNTNGLNEHCRLILQNDGNLVLYDSLNKPLWSTGTYGA